MTLNLSKTEDKALLKTVVREALDEAMNGGCLCGLDPETHRRHHELCGSVVTPKQAAANHQFTKDLRETATSALKKILITLVVGAVLTVMGLGVRAWFRGG